MLICRVVGCIIVGILFSQELFALQVSNVRYGQTEQRSRIVIESDGALQVKAKWLSDELVLEIGQLSAPISSSVLSASAIAIGVELQPGETNSSTQVRLPVLRHEFIRRFQLEQTQQMPSRLVIDWRRMSSLEKNDLLNDKKRLEQVENSEPEKRLPIKPSAQETIIKSKQEDLQSIRKRAKNSLTDGNFRLTISLLTKLLEKGNTDDKPFALEYLGVAREKIHQLAFAKQYYQRFLTEYPNSPHVARVQQRFNALIGIENISQNKTLKKGRRKLARKKSITRGSIASDYRQSDLVNDLGERRQTSSLVSVDFDLRGDYQLSESSLKVRFSGGHYQDLTDEGDGTNDRLRYANVGWQSKDRSYQIDVGRQRSRGKGIFGRYDGLLFGHAFNDTQKLNLVAGYPVASSKELSLDPERSFVGISYDWDKLWEKFDVSLFLIEQSIGDLTDRRAVGGELKYLDKTKSIYGLLDYDIFYSKLNAFLISGTYTTEDKVRYYWSFNQRKSPYISTRNALIGQAADSLAELQNLFVTDEEILDLALDRTLESKSASFQASKPFNKIFDLSTNLTWMNLSGAPGSGGVPDIAESGDQYYLSLYLGGRRLFSQNDFNKFGFRYSTLANSDIWSVFANSQYRWSKSWSINCKLRYDDRENKNGSSQQSISPGVRVQFQNRTNYFYLELGAVFYTNKTVGFSEQNTDIYYTFLGYRYYF